MCIGPDSCSTIIGGLQYYARQTVGARPLMVITDPVGNIYVDSVTNNRNGITIAGRNSNNEPRSIILNNDGTVINGYDRSTNLGIVGREFYAHRDKICQLAQVKLPDSHRPNSQPQSLRY